MRVRFPGIILSLSLLLASCAAPAEPTPPTTELPSNQGFPTPAIAFTPLPTRPPYEPGQLVAYTAQPGDTLPALAARFNTTEAEIRAANPIIPQDATTMPPGFPMQIPIYYKALWGTPYQILPDSLFINGPAQIGFDIQAYVNARPGWLKNYREQIADGPHSGAELIQIVATNFSVSPRLLLALLEYYSGALSKPETPADTAYLLNYHNPAYRGLYLQLVYAANTLNNGYYAWRRGTLLEFDHPDGRLYRPDPWQNAATVAIQYAVSRLYSSPLFDQIIGPGGLAETYTTLFGDPWENVTPHIPGSLQQPALLLPFEGGKAWNYTGGPHTGWGKGEPYAAVDFAPTGISGCNATTEWVTAMADGIVARSQPGEIMLDLDGDGDERTGWVIFYLHLAGQSRPPVGTRFKAGERLGHASCEGGKTTGTHIHIARKYNGEWMLADSPIPLNMDGWIVHNGSLPYKGTLTRFSQTVTASSKSERQSLIKREK